MKRRTTTQTCGSSLTPTDVHGDARSHLGATFATVDVILDDDPAPVATVSRSLSATRARWHALDVDLPSGTVSVVDAAPVDRCP